MLALIGNPVDEISYTSNFFAFKQQKAAKNRNFHQAFWVNFFNNPDKETN